MSYDPDIDPGQGPGSRSTTFPAIMAMFLIPLGLVLFALVGMLLTGGFK